MRLTVLGTAVLAVAYAHEEPENGGSAAMAHSPDHVAAAHPPMNMAMGEMANSTNITASPASMHSGHSHGMPILEMLDMLEPQQRAYWLAYDPTTYFNAETGSKALLFFYAFVNFMTLGLLLPMASLLAFSPKTQWLYLPLQTAVFALTTGGAVLAYIYSVTLEESLYPGNCYSIVTIILLATMAVHWIALVSKSAMQSYGTAMDGAEYHLTDMDVRHSQDSGNDCCDSIDGDLEEPDLEELPQGSPRQSRMVQQLVDSRFGGIFEKFHGVASSLFTCLTVPLALFGYAYLVLGALIGTRMGMGHNVFGLLAHAIKGSVFFLLGFVELARYFGAFASRGMAWNSININFNKETQQPSKWYKKLWPEYPTIEFLQSFLIFFYGATNIFLEHLGSSDGKWTHKDLQHVSIAFMFLGGGLCGMVCESSAVAGFLAKGFGYEVEGVLVRSWSYNIFPAMTIFWTGALMSQHQQETELATAIHVQWGTLLSAAAVSRVFTLALLYTKSNDNVHPEVPQRPFTELITSFCLICGGMIFVLSNRETVESMIYQGINSMFSLIVGVGITSLLMVCAALCFAFKGWATR